MIDHNPEELAKIHCLNALFSSQGAVSTELTHHIKSVIDYHLTRSTNERVSLEEFARMAIEILREQNYLSPSYGLFHLDLREREFDALWVQEELVRGLKRLSGCEQALLLVTGLRKSIAPHAKRWTRNLKDRHAECIDYIDDLAARYSSSSTKLTLIYL